MLSHELNALTRANTPLAWTEAHQGAFDRLKELICEEGGRVLRLYQRDAPTLLYTGWCDHGIVTIMSHLDPPELHLWHPMCNDHVTFGHSWMTFQSLHGKYHVVGRGHRYLNPTLI